MAFKFDINDKGFRRMVDQLKKNTKQSKKIMVEVAGEMMDSTEQNFQDEGRPKKWKSLSERRIAERKAKKTWPGKILQDTARLASSITPKATKDQAIVGTNVEYAKDMQEGNKKKRIPARPFLQIQKKEIKAIENIIAKGILKGVPRK